jgi:murein DD-endopeptidase MepM/ murein hydrolase activator NlpD
MAGGGGAVAPVNPPSGVSAPPNAGGGSSGGAVAGDAHPDEAPTDDAARPDRAGAGRPARRHRRPARRARRSATLLTAFSVSRKRVYPNGRPARLRFTLSGRRAVNVSLRVLSAADRAPVATIDLGERGPGDHVATFTGLETGIALPDGAYVLHLAGHGLRRAPGAASTADVAVSSFAFPVRGAFDWGSDGSRFGAGRDGHSHQGQDLAAAEGTPVVSPSGGLVEVVQYQAAGAGHYVVIDSDAADHDYVFMHLRTGSILVEEGDRVRTGQQIGEVGNTGRSSGAHLHFEVWVGGWYTGGEPIDPLPLLQSWA